jgi:hypothetical protein
MEPLVNWFCPGEVTHCRTFPKRTKKDLVLSSPAVARPPSSQIPARWKNSGPPESPLQIAGLGFPEANM